MHNAYLVLICSCRVTEGSNPNEDTVIMVKKIIGLDCTRSAILAPILAAKRGHFLNVAVASIKVRYNGRAPNQGVSSQIRIAILPASFGLFNIVPARLGKSDSPKVERYV